MAAGILEMALLQLAEESSCGMIILDKALQLIYANGAARAMAAMPERLREEDILAQLCGGKMLQLTFDQSTLLVSGKQYLTEQGLLYLVNLLDISEQKSYEDRYHLFSCFLNASENQGIIACDTGGRIIFFNDHAARMEGMNPKDVIGRHLNEVYTYYNSSNMMKTIENGTSMVDVEFRYRTFTGKTVRSMGCVYPVTRGGRLIAVFAVSRYTDHLRQLLLRSMEIQKQLFEETRSQYNGTRFTFDDICGESPAITEAVANAKKAVLSPSPVLIYGETGCGKELFAQGIHNSGLNSKEPFVAVNCAAIPVSIMESILFGTEKGVFTGAEKREGLFEQAGKGSIYLDEIQSMPLELQVKLLRVLQERSLRRVGGGKEAPVQCRVISSINMAPQDCLDQGLMRKDLYYRLSAISIHVPPLRERGDDVLCLARHFCKKYGAIYGKHNIVIDPGSQEILRQYNWPGNVRELEHIVEQTMVMLEGSTLTSRDLPQLLLRPGAIPEMETAGWSYPPRPLSEILMAEERNAILAALKRHDWNISRAAAELDIARSNL